MSHSIASNSSVRTIEESSANEILEGFGVAQTHLKRIEELGRNELVQPALLVADFYRWLENRPWKQKFFGPSVPSRVRAAQVKYWQEFLNGRVDKAYVQSRFLVGETHARIGLPPRAYATSMAFSQRWLIDAARKTNEEPRQLLEVEYAIGVLCQLDCSLVMDAYAHHSNRLLQEEASKQSSINQEITRVVVSASQGNFAERYRPRGTEDGSLADAMNGMLSGLENTVRRIIAVSEGDYSEAPKPKSEQDELGRVIFEMTRRLKEFDESTRREQWIKQGQSVVFEKMRGELKIDELAESVLTYLAEELGCPVGCIYVPVEDDGTRLELSASFGRLPDSLPQEVRIGDGIFGEAARARKNIWNLNIESNPIDVFFGLGTMRLTRVSIVPLIADNHLRGMLQLASEEDLSKQAAELLEMVVENVAIAFGAAVSRRQMSQLLLQEQVQSEELQAQAEELRISNDELANRSHALEKSREDVELRNAELQRQQQEIRVAQKELQEHADELAQASKYKTEFLANVSHELRTPLNSILILASTMAENRDGNLTESQRKSLAVIQEGGRDLLRLINDVLDLSKVEAGALALHVEEVQVESIVNSLRDQFLPVADQSKVSFECLIEPDVPETLTTDMYRVVQILKNFLSNAFKFTHQGRVQLVVSVDRSEGQQNASENRENDSIRFSVADTGIGISPAMQDDVFEVFRQADGSTSREYGGSGLGLSISKQLADALGGEISVESELGKGSVFSLSLSCSTLGVVAPQLAKSEDSANSKPSEPGPRFTSIRLVEDSLGGEVDSETSNETTVLIVEDDAVFREALCEAVVDQGYQVLSTGSGKEALVLAEQASVRGVLMDLGLPDMDGLQVLEQFKDNPKTCHLPVHVLSGHACRPDVMQLGAVGLSQKPIGLSQMQEVFRRFEELWARAHGSVLVVEDDPVAQALIFNLFKRLDTEVTSASTGAEALELVQSHEFDCIVLDIGLPDMTGDELLKQMPESLPPVVVYTGEMLDERRMFELSRYTRNFVLKGAHSPARLLEEVGRFIHFKPKTSRESASRESTTNRGVVDSGSSPRIILADDDTRNVFAISELLRGKGVEVLVAGTGEETLELLKQHPDVQLVFMDIMMPVMDGIEAIRRIRQNSRWTDLPIVAMTAKTLPEDRLACMEAGASEYLAKPVESENLLALMRVLLSKNTGAKQALG